MRYEVYDGTNWLASNKFPDKWHGRRKLRLLLIFNKEELKYDIASLAFSQGDVARVNDNYGHDLLGDDREHLMHQWKDICEEGNYDRVQRIEALALSEVEQLLYKYVASFMHRFTSSDNRIDGKSEYAMELHVPSSFSDTTCWYIMRLIHEYIMDRVLGDWASITYPEAQERWEIKAKDTAEKIKIASTMCGSPVHRVNPSII